MPHPYVPATSICHAGATSPWLPVPDLAPAGRRMPKHRAAREFAQLRPPPLDLDTSPPDPSPPSSCCLLQEAPQRPKQPWTRPQGARRHRHAIVRPTSGTGAPRLDPPLCPVPGRSRCPCRPPRPASPRPDLVKSSAWLPSSALVGDDERAGSSLQPHGPPGPLRPCAPARLQ